jgi:hypothetical protein
MSRFLGSAACSALPDAGAPPTSEGLVIGLDGIRVIGAQSTAGTAACNGAAADCDPTTDPSAGVAWNTTVTRPTKGPYTFSGWQDVLRILYGGVSNDPNDTGCNSEIRNYVANHWSALFEASACTSGTCTQIQHIFRPDDASGTAVVLASPLGLSPTPSAVANNGFGASPFCNAMNWDTSAANTSGAGCGLGPHDQFVGPGGVDDPASTTTPKLRKPPPGTWGEAPLGISAAKSAWDVLPTQMQDNDPIRRPCLGTGKTNNPLNPGEEVCGLDNALGLVLALLHSDWIVGQTYPNPAGGSGPALAQYPTNACHSFAAGTAPKVFNCAVNRTSLHEGECPNGDSETGGACIIPIDATGNRSDCVATKATIPTLVQRTTLGNTYGRVYNLHLRDGTIRTDGSAIGYAQYPVNSIATLDMAGAYNRIHQVETAVGTSASSCQMKSASDQIACLAQASPCSLSVAGGNTSAQPGVVALKVQALDPTSSCIQSTNYPLWRKLYLIWRKLYLNTLAGFSHVSGPELAFAQCEANSATVNAALLQFGFTQLPATWSSAPNGGAPYCEYFDEQVACGAASNANACAGNAAVGHPTTGTTCGNGMVEALEPCDNGAANGPPPAVCSTICRANPAAQRPQWPGAASVSATATGPTTVQITSRASFLCAASEFGNNASRPRPWVGSVGMGRPVAKA